MRRSEVSTRHGRLAAGRQSASEHSVSTFTSASNSARNIRVGPISLWKVAKKVQIGKLQLAKDLAAWFADALAPNIELLPLTAEVVTEAMHLPEFPNRDPADELIVATARVHKLTLITTDTKVKNYRHARIHYFTPIVEKAR